MKKRALTGVFLFVLTVGMIAGCGKQEVDYDMTGDNSEQSSEHEGGSLSDYRDMAKWQDEWNTVSMLGTDIKVLVDAEIVVPNVDGMHVIVAEREKIDAEAKEHFLKSFFEEGEIYYDDMEDNPAECQELLSAVPENYVEAEDFESCLRYIGSREGLLYYASFGTIEHWGHHSNIRLMNPEEGAPSSLLNGGYDKVNYMGGEDIEAENEISNECKFSEEEARNLADTYISKLGRANQVCIETKPMLWRGENYDENGRMTEAEVSYYGYTFTYGTGIDGAAFLDFPNYACLDTKWAAEPQPADYFGGDEIVVMVTDLGVTEVSFSDPIIIREVSEPVELLPLDTIQGIIEGEVEGHGERYEFRSGNTFDKLELVYLALKDKSEEDVYSYIPVWCLQRSDYGKPILVNAMDGSILYVLEQKIPEREE